MEKERWRGCGRSGEMWRNTLGKIEVACGPGCGIVESGRETYLVMQCIITKLYKRGMKGRLLKKNGSCRKARTESKLTKYKDDKKLCI